MKHSICSSLYASLFVVAMAVMLFSACQQQSTSPTGETAGSSMDKVAANIVFIYADTILAKYEVFQQKGAELAKREQEETAKLQQKGKALEDEV
ncbi:MAG: hypothetical protein KDD15_15775, partial [Lewinella sp.]|nr:hypothetical protein [Lewinella sp.]